MKKHILAVVLTVVLAAAAVLAVTSKLSLSVRISASSTLQDIIDIDELSTAEFAYNGIASVYEDNGKDVRFYALYHSTIKVGINLSEARIVRTDEEKKEITIALPAVSIIDEPIIDDRSLSFMKPGTYSVFSPNDFDLKSALTACRQDARTEAEQSSELIAAAEENLQNTIRAFMTPIIGSDYTYVWQVPASGNGGAQ